MKTKAKMMLIGFLSTLCLCFFLSLNVEFTASAIEESQFEQVTYFANVNRSIELLVQAKSEQLSAPSITKSIGNNGQTNIADSDFVAYNDDFAGIYIDDKGLLNIGLVGIGHTYSDYGGHVIYRPRNFSYNYLRKVRDELVKVMSYYGIYFTAIDEELNLVVVFINNEEYIANSILHLAERDLYNENAINFVVKQNENGQFTERASLTAHGGERINTSFLGFVDKWGTICMNAYDNDTGKYGVITNAHVADSGKTMYYEGNVLHGTKIGDTTKWKNSGSIDAAFVPFENQSNWTVTANAIGSTTYTNIRLGDESLIVQGLPVKSLGRKSGERTGTVRYTQGGNINGKTNTVVFNIHVDDGDSGAPIYFDGGGQNLFLIAMLFAGDPGFVAACRISEVINEFNITPVLNGHSINGLIIDNNIVTGYIPEVVNNQSTLFIPNGVTAISNGALADAQMSQISIPASVTSIGSGVFRNCTALTEISVASGNQNYVAQDGGLYNTSISKIVVYPAGKRNASFIIPSWVKRIDSYAFAYNPYLQSITIHSNVVNIDSYAFAYCSNLTIYCESISNIWHTDWNPSHCPVVLESGVNILSSNVYVDLSDTYFDDGTPIIGTFYYDNFLSSRGLTRSDVISSELELGVSQGQEYSFYLYNGDSWELIGILSEGIKFSLEQFNSGVVIFKLLCIDSATQWGYLSGEATLTIEYNI